MLLLAFMIFIIIKTAACHSAINDTELSDFTLPSTHPAVLGTESPLNIFSSVESLLTMHVTDISDISVTTITQNNSEWYARTDYFYEVETLVNSQWLPIAFSDYFAFISAEGPSIAPNDSLTEHFILPNFNPFPTPESLPLEPGRYRVRRTVIINAGMADDFSVIILGHHELVAEFYVTDTEQ